MAKRKGRGVKKPRQWKRLPSGRLKKPTAKKPSALTKLRAELARLKKQLARAKKAAKPAKQRPKAKPKPPKVRKPKPLPKSKPVKVPRTPKVKVKRTRRPRKVSVKRPKVPTWVQAWPPKPKPKPKPRRPRKAKPPKGETAYAKRIRNALARGLTLDQARGHASRGRGHPPASDVRKAVELLADETFLRQQLPKGTRIDALKRAIANLGGVATAKGYAELMHRLYGTPHRVTYAVLYRGTAPRSGMRAVA